ncbi:MAG: hypothetical protein AAF608_05190 [Pseudomonadota bacterium]
MAIAHYHLADMLGSMRHLLGEMPKLRASSLISHEEMFRDSRVPREHLEAYQDEKLRRMMAAEISESTPVTLENHPHGEELSRTVYVLTTEQADRLYQMINTMTRLAGGGDQLVGDFDDSLPSGQ